MFCGWDEIAAGDVHAPAIWFPCWDYLTQCHGDADRDNNVDNADLLILIPTTSFFKQTYLILLFPVLQLIYPFYIVFTVILGLAGKFVWKSRLYK